MERSVPDHSHIKSMMAANYHDRYYRVLVTGFVTENVVTGLYIDIGSSAEEGVLVASSAVNLRQTSDIREEEGPEIEASKR